MVKHQISTFLSLLLLLLIFIGVQLIYNVMLVSTVQQSESAIHTHISPLFFFSFPFGQHRAMSRVPCVIQQVLISYLFYAQYQQCIYVNLNLSIHPSNPTPYPLVDICLFSTSVSQFLPCKLVHLYPFARFHIHALIYDICFSLSDLFHSV